MRGYCAQCKSRCGTVAVVSPDDELLSVRPDPHHPNHGFCVKGAAAPQFVHDPGRLRQPMRRTNPKTDGAPGWVPVGPHARAGHAVRAGVRRVHRPAPGGSHAGDWSPYLDRLAAAFGSPTC